MAFVLTPSFVPAYHAPRYGRFGVCAPTPQPSYGYRRVCLQPQRPQYSPFSQFIGQLGELLGEMDHQTQREAHRQRQQRKRALRAKFAVTQNEQGWQVDGDIQGFARENIGIEVTDEHTLKIAGNTTWQSEEANQETAPAAAIKHNTEEAQAEKSDEVALSETETATVAADSDVESNKSYQATVEDDFEDLGAEFSSVVSTSSESEADETEKPSVSEKKEGKKPVQESATKETEQAPQEPEKEERVHGSFERTFKFSERISAAGVTATFEGGKLSITVPRAPAQEIKKITIS